MVMALRAAGQSVDVASIETMLEEVGLTDRADHLPAELSVGQKRRLVPVSYTHLRERGFKRLFAAACEKILSDGGEFYDEEQRTRH